ncbi:aspartate--tRNA ligase, partial [Roseomonas sp. DSM 102946]|nr:aspartate--tRNA ligase [Roseomonas sp. DSM 102946]
RIVMLLADEPNIREVILFPLNQQGEDLMMHAPAPVEPARLKELSIRLDLPPAKPAGKPAGQGETQKETSKDTAEASGGAAKA